MQDPDKQLSEYRKALAYAREVFRAWGVTCLDCKEAHDFAMDCIIEMGRCNQKNIRMRMIDSLRRQNGRKTKATAKSKHRHTDRQWERINGLVVARKEREPQDIDDLLMQFRLTTTEHFILSMVCCGVLAKTIGSMLGVSESAVCQAIKKASVAIRESGLYCASFYDTKMDRNARRRWRVRMSRPMESLKVAHERTRDR